MASRQRAASKQTVELTIERYYRAINAKNVDAIVDVFEPDGTFQYPESSPIRGREEIRRAEERILAPIGEITLTPDQTFIIGNRAAVKFTMQAKAKNGRSATMEGIDTFQIYPDGKIQSVSVYYDATALSALLHPSSSASQQ